MEREQYDIERKQSTFVEAIHRTLDPFSLDTALLFIFSLFFSLLFFFFSFFSRIKRGGFARDNEFSNGRTSTEGWRHSVGRMLSEFAVRDAFLRDVRARSARRISRDFRLAIIFALAYRYVSQKVLFTLQFKSFNIFS